MMYKLTKSKESKVNTGTLVAAAKQLFGLMSDERRVLALSFVTILVTSGLNLLAPYLFGRAIDTAVSQGNYSLVLTFSAGLFVIFLISFASNYVQMKWMGGVGQRVLYKLRNVVFTKLQELPIAFFNQNKSGDLISRLNNDTDKLNQFFSETVMRFVGSFFVMLGAAIFVLGIHWQLGLVALAPAAVLLVLTQFLSPWVKKRTTESLQTTGALSAEVQESLDNFRVIVAFHRRDYFRTRFQEANETNYKASVRAGLANGIFMPLYDISANLANLFVIIYGVMLVSGGSLTVGLLMSFFIYIERFYGPFRQMAMLWSSLQLAMAGWDRVSEILDQKSEMEEVKALSSIPTAPLLEFKGVDFGYPEGKQVLRSISFTLERGQTYALVGPTGGGKTTTASLMARLYDPTAGTVFLEGRDLRSFSPEERTAKIGFILQEPFLFSGTVLENIFYANDLYKEATKEDMMKVIEDANLGKLLSRFEKGLDTEVTPSGGSMSLGQRQLIAFMRAVLRKPALLVLDEATANIDTVTEQLLEETLAQLPKETTKVIIAHRLNTIEEADQIFFVNEGEIKHAGSLQQAVDLLMHKKRSS